MGGVDTLFRNEVKNVPTITDFSRVTIEYTSDQAAGAGLAIYGVSQRTAVQVAVGNPLAAANLPGRPAKWKLRCIYLVTPTTGAITNRKRCVIGDIGNPLFSGSVSGPITLDGVQWRVEGRTGERRTTG